MEKIVHGDLVDIFGVGVLIVGESAIGKSETALDLIQRGHRLTADDAVVLMKKDDKIVGTAPPLTRHMMEIRGIGIIDIRALYGVAALKLEQDVDLIVSLEEWSPEKDYTPKKEPEYETVFGIQIEKLTIPIRPGRNIPSILEVAASNFRLCHLGYNAMTELQKRLKTDD